MRSVAKVILLGNLGKDVELRYSPSGTAVANFSVATTEGKKNKDGEWENTTTWFRVTVWGKQAENCSKNLNKGDKVYVDGRLSQETWTDRDENERTTLLVNASEVHSLETKKSNNNGDVEESEIPF